MITTVVYLLCALTSTWCAVLLFNKYKRNTSRLLLWSAVCFLCLALNNSVLFIDYVLTSPSVDLSVIRTVPAVVGYAALLWGFIWDSA